MEYLQKGTKSGLFLQMTNTAFSGKGGQKMKNVEMKLDGDILTIKVDSKWVVNGDGSIYGSKWGRFYLLTGMPGFVY